jgi:hypothetical protein
MEIYDPFLVGVVNQCNAIFLPRFILPSLVMVFGCFGQSHEDD